MCEVQGCAWDSPIGGLLLTARLRDVPDSKFTIFVSIHKY